MISIFKEKSIFEGSETYKFTDAALETLVNKLSQGRTCLLVSQKQAGIEAESDYLLYQTTFHFGSEKVVISNKILAYKYFGVN